MTNLKDRWLELLNTYVADDDDNQQQSDTATPATVLLSVDTSAEDTEVAQVDDLPLYTATEAEREFWRKSAFKDALQDLLRQYDLDGYPPNRGAFRHFRIGFDVKRHVATFFVDKTHYHVIPFDKDDSAPVDDNEARRVLKRISELRQQRSYFRLIDGDLIERFDDVENICAALSREVLPES